MSAETLFLLKNTKSIHLGANKASQRDAKTAASLCFPPLLAALAQHKGRVMNKLYECYLELKNILGNEIESFESIQLVEEYRKYWKPKNVKIILLAESHVFTSDSDRDIKLKNNTKLPSFPREYAKFVYCLAYGERTLTNDKSHPRRDGTPQFWKIFYSCVNKVEGNQDFEPILSKTPYSERILNKIAILNKMKESGVWLVDTSIAALYNSGKKPNSKIRSQAIKASWKGYTKNVIQESNPDYVIIIGKDVARTIEKEIKNIMGSSYSVISQPNAHLSGEDHLKNFKKYFELCV